MTPPRRDAPGSASSATCGTPGTTTGRRGSRSRSPGMRPSSAPIRRGRARLGRPRAELARRRHRTARSTRGSRSASRRWMAPVRRPTPRSGAHARSVGAFDAEMTAAVLEGDARVEAGRRRRPRVHGRGARSGLRRRAGPPGRDHVRLLPAVRRRAGGCATDEHAFQWCERVADLCERRNIWSVLSATRCSYAAILIARGRSRRPSVSSSPPNRATARRGCRVAPRGRGRLARGLAVPAGPIRRGEAARREPRSRQARTAAAIAFAQGRGDDATEQRAVLRHDDAQQVVLRAAALELLVRAEISGERPPGARRALPGACGARQQVGQPPVESARAGRPGGESTRTAGRSNPARLALADAVELFEAGEAP